jgi:hypothetical protein
MTTNSYPTGRGLGPGVAFTRVQGGAPTANFKLDIGLYVVAVELDDQRLPNDQVLLQSIGSTGTATTVLTVDRNGYYNYSNMVAGQTFNFLSTNNAKNLRMNAVML